MAAALRPARIEDIVDGHKLRAQLSAAALDHLGDQDAATRRARDLLHGALFRGRIIAKERLEAGAGGHETARILAGVADEVIAALYAFTTTHIFRSRNPTEAERFAIVAVGGYGRGQLAPSSDIDLLFLRAYKQTAFAESVTEYVLYRLWDMSLKVGHSSRTIEETLRLAREDHTIQTALLEARHIAGDSALTAELIRRYRDEVATPGHRAFVGAKLKERDARHARAGASRYMVEPNIKEGKGGLRDLHTLFWICRHRYGLSDPRDYVREGVFTPEEVTTFLRASDFLWRVRCHLHFLTGRAEERLTFDLQPEMAQRMGYGNRGEQPAVERFMRRYFLTAKDVGGLSRILAAKLDAERAKGGMLAGFLAPAKRPLGHGFVSAGTSLIAHAADMFDRDPANLLRAFLLADQNGLEIHPETLSLITRKLRLITPSLRRTPEACAIFLELAASPRDPAKALANMNEAGVLGRFVPEFGRIVAQMQFNMYHHYTVDEHTLRAVEIISDIEHGKFRAEHPLSTDIFPKIINRRALYLAMLLHDTGKGEGDQQIEGEKSARTVCQRLGLPQEETDLVGWLVRHHLAMSDVAQKRDIGDPRTLASFADLVGDVERLRLLLVLTVADIRAVGPGVWNGWKGQLLRDLYRLTEAMLHGARTDEAGVRERLSTFADEARATLAAHLDPHRAAALKPWFDTLDAPYWLSFDSEALAWHAEEAVHGLAGDAAHVAARPSPRKGVTELLVYANDRPGLFARLAGAIAACGADITDARVHTTRSGKAFDAFSIQGADGRPFGIDDEAALQRLLARLRSAAAAEGASSAAPAPPPPSRRTAAFRIEPWVRIDQELSQSSTVIEISGRDRPGILAALAHAIAQAGLTLASAHVDSYGERFADVFYVQDLAGEKPCDAGQIQALEAALLDVLREGEPEGPATLARQPLAVARASKAR
jgi:[protein-PII] uridylyltransferase